MPIIKSSSTRKRRNDYDFDADMRERRREADRGRRERERDRDRDRDRVPEKRRDDDVQRERVDELIKLLQKNTHESERDDEESTTECETDFERRRDEDKLDRAAEAIQSNKGNYYANTRRLWELDRELAPYVRDPEAKRLLNEKMKRTIQYFLDTYLFSKTSDPMRHLDNFCAKYNFIE